MKIFWELKDSTSELTSRYAAPILAYKFLYNKIVSDWNEKRKTDKDWLEHEQKELNQLLRAYEDNKDDFSYASYHVRKVIEKE